MFRCLKLLTVSFAFSFGVALAQEPVVDIEANLPSKTDYELYSQEIKEGLEKKGSIVGIKKLPITTLYFVEAEQGSYLISQDGRFVIDGSIKDVWHRKTLRSLPDLAGIDRVPFAANAKKMDQLLATYTIGDPQSPRAGAIFVDPLAEITNQALKKLEEVSTETHWKVVLMPLVNGAPAVNRAKRIWCAEDQTQAKRDLIDGTSKALNTLRDDCDDTRVVASEMITNIFNIVELPHVIREDGLSAKGFPVEFDAWFAQP